MYIHILVYDMSLNILNWKLNYSLTAEKWKRPEANHDIKHLVKTDSLLMYDNHVL